MIKFDDFVRNLGRLKVMVPKVADKIFSTYFEPIKTDNTMRLLNEGTDTKGKIIGTYKPKTVERRIKAGKPVPGDRHWMSLWEGIFLQEINLEKKELNKFEIKSNFSGYKAMKEYDEFYLGLTDKEEKIYGELLTNELTKSIVSILKGNL
jgi:hypothetical protein